MNEIMKLMLYYFLISILFQGFMAWTIIDFNGKMTKLIVEALAETKKPYRKINSNSYFGFRN